jgi:hypothetical protein
MKKKTKFFGLFCSLTALMVCIFVVKTSTENANAISINAPNDSADVKVKVVVRNDYPTIDILSPLDNSTIIGKNVSFKINYTDASSLEYELIYVAEDGSKTSYDLPKNILSTNSKETGKHEFELNLRDYGDKYGDYILRAKAFGLGSATDMAAFKVTSFDFVIKGQEQTTQNPIITVIKSPGVKKVRIRVYDDSGKEILTQPLEIALNQDADTDVILPLAKYGSPEGEYRVTVSPLDENGEIVDEPKNRNVKYVPAEAPEVPDTGFAFGVLGVSSEDVATSGLILIIISGILGIIILLKKNREEESR